MKNSAPFKRCALAAAVMGVVLMSAPAVAQTERELELEARIAELERLVNDLVTRQDAAPPPPAAVPQGQQPVQATTVVPTANAGTKFAYGGFIKFNSTYSDYTDGSLAAGSVGRDFYLPGVIPVGGAGGESPVFDAHAKQSRFWLTTDTVLDNGSKLGSRIEIDFAVPVGGDERNTNTYNPVLRRAYLTYDNWLFGQEWSNFMELGALPEAVDFIGPTEGMVFVRQPQIRYTSGPWSVSLENPETTTIPFGGGARIVNDDNTIPDVIARYRHVGDWGFIAVAGMARQLRTATGSADSSDTGFGVSVTSKINLGADDIRLMVTGGQGIGRYIGLNYFEDSVFDAGGDIDALDVLGAYFSYRHVWGGTWRSNFTLGYTEVDNDSLLTGLGANQSAQSARVNLLWSPAPKLDIGFELSTAKREVESGDAGEMNRIDFMAKYSF